MLASARPTSRRLGQPERVPSPVAHRWPVLTPRCACYGPRRKYVYLVCLSGFTSNLASVWLPCLHLATSVNKSRSRRASSRTLRRQTRRATDRPTDPTNHQLLCDCNSLCLIHPRAPPPPPTLPLSSVTNFRFPLLHACTQAEPEPDRTAYPTAAHCLFSSSLIAPV
jgi:hypothetical protein